MYNVAGYLVFPAEWCLFELFWMSDLSLLLEGNKSFILQTLLSSTSNPNTL